MTDEIYHGREVSILYDVETTAGTAVVPSREMFFSATATASETKNVVVKHGQGTAAPKLAEGKYEVSGSISGSLQHAEILEYIIGTPSDAGSAPTTHTISSPSESVSPLTIQYGLDGTASQSATYAGCYINNLEITAATDDVAQIKVDWVGMTVASAGSVVSAVVSTDNLFSMKEASLTIGSAIACIENASFKFTRGAEVSHGIGSLTACALKSGNWEVEVSFTGKLINTTEYQRFLGGTSPDASTAATVVLKFDNGETGADEREITLTATGALYTTFDTDYGTDKYTTFTGTLNASSCSLEAKDNTANWDA